MATLVQGTLVVVLGLLAIIDGVGTGLSIRQKNPNLYDVVGPDRYVAAVGVGLVILGIAYLLTTYRRPSSAGLVSREGRAALLLTTGALVAYGVLLEYVGYAVSTLLFFLAFLATFAIMGVALWRFNAILTVTSTAIYYVFFVHVARLVFPRGVLDLWR